MCQLIAAAFAITANSRRHHRMYNYIISVATFFSQPLRVSRRL